jgi:glycine betaine/proline transport system substrate-binding protein
VRLSSVPHDAVEWKRCTSVADCPDPKLNDWPTELAKTLVTAKFAQRSGAMMDYLKARKISNADINNAMSWATDNQASGEDAAKYFLKTSPEVWSKWVAPAVAKKIKDSL